jgi:hypothetical protein
MNGKEIRIIGFNNQKGLTKDIDILCHQLATLDAPVNFLEIGEKICATTLQKTINLTKALIQSRLSARKEKRISIFLERVVPELLGDSQFNLLIPNPEWFHPTWRFFSGAIDVVLCKSYHAIGIYESLGFRTQYLGFTSPDRKTEHGINKQPGFLHVAGGSHFKGTAQLVKTWEQHPEWPMLLVVTHRVLMDYVSPASNVKIWSHFIDDQSLLKLQNEMLFHIYPSQAEGFGHCINEAMSCGAIVLTNSAPPMDELVTSQTGFLFDCRLKGRQCLSPLVEFEPQAFVHQVKRALAESPDIQKQRSAQARATYEARHLCFETNLKAIVQEYLAAL